jgi:hypothetical protein
VYAASKELGYRSALSPGGEKKGLISKQALKGLSAAQVPFFSAHSVHWTEGALQMINPERRQSIYKCGDESPL